MSTLIKKIIVTTSMEVITGIHIGGSKETVEIGGIDNPVIRAFVKDNQPYIPGSSLKGKIRSLLEQIDGISKIGGSETINSVFGGGNDLLKSKLIVRDAYLSNESVNLLKSKESLDMPFTEAKWENNINRVNSKADPRQTERIPAGVFFDVEFVINVWDNDEDGKKSVDMLQKGIKALENDYLGGSGSRGYGQVRFSELKKEEIRFESYFNA